MTIAGVKHIIICKSEMLPCEYKDAQYILSTLKGDGYVKEEDVESITKSLKALCPNVKYKVISAECF
jgi:hypothetical protein